jgi:hypothetical protein
MQAHANLAPSNDASDSAPAGNPNRTPEAADGAVLPIPIGQLTERPDWPQCALGVFVSINGVEGVVSEIINQSIKVLTADRTTQRFNAGRLRTLFAPPERTKPPAIVPAPEETKVKARTLPPAETVADEPPRRNRITEPDFVAPLRPIRSYASQIDFPQCAFGKHVDIRGYSGVVIEIVDGSLKIQTQAGSVRSFNGAMLRKIYGQS